MDIKSKTNLEFSRFGLDAHYLLAMSGGIDSTVLFYLMKDLKINFTVAHAQYNLRGEASKLDEGFLIELCKKYNIKYLVKEFDVQAHMQQHHYSLQMSARELRYDWFREILGTNTISHIVTAHHLNDSIETFFINFLRGTGLKGLTGINHQKNIIRPLRLVTNKEIESYARENHIKWREDKTNAEDNYLRNKIRHHVVPQLESITPDFSERFADTLTNLNSDYDLLENLIDNLRLELFEENNGGYQINIEKLNALPNLGALHHLFFPFGFKNPDAIQRLLQGNESAEIESDQYRLIKNRLHLLLIKKYPVTQTFFQIGDLNEITHPIHLRFKKILTRPLQNSNHLDFEKIKFPLYLRVRENGDKFYPQGMGGKSKKVSKFFKDLKLSKLEKENTWILCDANHNIIGILGLRWDERFIATKETNIWLQIEKLD